MALQLHTPQVPAVPCTSARTSQGQLQPVCCLLLLNTALQTCDTSLLQQCKDVKVASIVMPWVPDSHAPVWTCNKVFERLLSSVEFSVDSLLDMTPKALSSKMCSPSTFEGCMVILHSRWHLHSLQVLAWGTNRLLDGLQHWGQRKVQS